MFIPINTKEQNIFCFAKFICLLSLSHIILFTDPDLGYR
ncbi:unnamed protein product [Acanthoscelides obtectus]|uniref:Uncharacterized protein n=1 Tax=Acanthoscelides obtectus TaxID=200917 RepID=A0A9P0M3Q8_ACAOB|nr:unnamed protein product [Acanthoscelides obtectus]CAK1635802.1 hypothetical protein AOBTE_LOCUS9518 [Acanthoscelides obtectus]